MDTTIPTCFLISTPSSLVVGVGVFLIKYYSSVSPQCFSFLHNCLVNRRHMVEYDKVELVLFGKL